MIHFIYAIKNKLDNKYYIGLTNNWKRRMNRHFTDLRCRVHDNLHLQRAFEKYGEDNFEFTVLLETKCSREEISNLEQQYVQKYDSFNNGYNMNKGGFQNNGFESKLNESDIFNILSVLEFIDGKSGQVLADLYEVSRTTITRIKNGRSHLEYKVKYEALSYDKRKMIFDGFCKDTNLIEKKHKSTALKGKRKLDLNQVLMVLSVFEFDTKKKAVMARNLGVKENTLHTITLGLSYQDYKDIYDKMSIDEKQALYNKAKLTLI